MISNTPTVTSYTFSYFGMSACILAVMMLHWMVHVVVVEQVFRTYWKYSLRVNSETFFRARTINERVDLQTLVRLRQQSTRLLPYPGLLSSVERHET